MIGLIERFFAWYKSTKFRKFYHKDGFGDDTEYIEWHKGVATCVSEHGVRFRSKWITLAWLEKTVQAGVFREGA